MSVAAHSSSLQRWLVAALLAVFVAGSVQYGLKIHRDSRLGTPTRSAVLRWLPQVEELLAGKDIYRAYNFPNPPVMTLFLVPLTPLDPMAAGLIAYYVKVLLALAAFALVFRLVESPGRPFPVWAKVLTVLLSLRPVLGDLSHGNINLLILFLVVSALALFRGRRDYSAGVVLALAIACKLTPALFVPYFIWKRAWRTLVGCAVGLVLFFVLVPGLYFGFDANQRYLTGWIDGMVLPYVRDGKVTSEENNQSLPGLLWRLTTRHPSATSWDDETQRYVPLAYHNVVELSPPVVRWGLKGLILAFTGMVVWTCRTPTADRRDWRLAAEYGVVLVGMLLFCERTWKHHAVTLLVPFAVLSYALATGRLNRVSRWGIVAALATAAALMAATISGLTPDQSAAGAKEIDLAQVYGAYTLAFGVLLGALIFVLRAPPERSASAGRLTDEPAQPPVAA